VGHRGSARDYNRGRRGDYPVMLTDKTDLARRVLDLEFDHALLFHQFHEFLNIVDFHSGEAINS
jgi:hypothetical protein